MRNQRAAEGRILIVEDIKGHQRRLEKQCQRALREIGFEAIISIAVDAEAAENALEESARSSQPFDLVTMDINLSGIDTLGAGAQGMELLRLIEDRLPNTYVVVVTGEEKPEQVAEFFGLSRVVAYIRKQALRNEVIRTMAQITVLHANALRRIQDPKHPYGEWQGLQEWIDQIRALQVQLVEQGGPTLKFPDSVHAKRAEYLDSDTMLPGEKAVEERLRVLPREDAWTIMVVKVEHLDRFAQISGGEKGKATVLRTVASVTGKVLEEKCEEHVFVGRRRDEIIAIGDSPSDDEVSSEIRCRFIKKRAALYPLRYRSDAEELDEKKVKHPLIEVRIGTITRKEMGEFYDVLDIEEAIARLISQ